MNKSQGIITVCGPREFTRYLFGIWSLIWMMIPHGIKIATSADHRRPAHTARSPSQSHVHLQPLLFSAPPLSQSLSHKAIPRSATPHLLPASPVKPPTILSSSRLPPSPLSLTAPQLMAVFYLLSWSRTSSAKAPLPFYLSAIR